MSAWADYDIGAGMPIFAKWTVELLTSPAYVALLIMFAGGSLLEAAFSPTPMAWRTRRLNLVYGLAAGIAEFALSGLKALTVTLAVRACGWSGLVDLSFADAPGALGSLASILLVMLAADFFLYWMHRLEHRVPWLWDEHVLHHSDRHVTVTSTTRLHPISWVLRAVLVSTPMAVMFKLPAPGIVALGLLPYLWLYVIHLDLRLGFGPLWWLATSPQYHLIHHSSDPRHQDRNFAAFFPVWDIVFGTAYRPAPDEYPAPGVPGVTVETLGGALALPLHRWAARLKAHERASAGHATHQHTAS